MKNDSMEIDKQTGKRELETDEEITNICGDKELWMKEILNTTEAWNKLENSIKKDQGYIKKTDLFKEESKIHESINKIINKLKSNPNAKDLPTLEMVIEEVKKSSKLQRKLNPQKMQKLFL